MKIAWLGLRNFRNIRELQIEPAERVNWILGGNGAGKSSVLESMFLLARGRTFRSSRYGALVRHGAKALEISSKLVRNETFAKVEMIANGKGKALYDNGNRVRRVRELKDRIQVRLIGDNPQRLLEGDPEVRRFFLDWNLFHVEHRYPEWLTSFRRVLSQRNAWLRSGGCAPSVWDDEFLSLAKKLTDERIAFVEDLSRELSTLIDFKRYAEAPTARLYCGWPEGRSLEDVLSESYGLDRRRGYTGCGPSRADVRLDFGGNSGLRSRGETKAIVCLIQLAAQRVSEARGGGSCIWLLDDLGAELDSDGFLELWRKFEETGAQIFSTALEMNKNLKFGSVLGGHRVFHVEQGALRTIDAGDHL